MLCCVLVLSNVTEMKEMPGSSVPSNWMYIHTCNCRYFSVFVSNKNRMYILLQLSKLYILCNCYSSISSIEEGKRKWKTEVDVDLI